MNKPTHSAKDLATAALALNLHPDQLAEALATVGTPAQKNHRFLHPEDIAEALSVSRATIIRRCRDGSLPCKRVGSQWRIADTALEIA